MSLVVVAWGVVAGDVDSGTGRAGRGRGGPVVWGVVAWIGGVGGVRAGANCKGFCQCV